MPAPDEVIRLDPTMRHRGVWWRLFLSGIWPDGGTIAEIAAKLYLSEGTVRNYLSACIQKTGARNRADTLRIASERGWL